MPEAYVDELLSLGATIWYNDWCSVNGYEITFPTMRQALSNSDKMVELSEKYGESGIPIAMQEAYVKQFENIRRLSREEAIN